MTRRELATFICRMLALFLVAQAAFLTITGAVYFLGVLLFAPFYDTLVSLAATGGSAPFGSG